MEADVLKKAKTHQKNREWEKAIAYYESYMQTNEPSNDAVYAAYAACLRHAGRTRQAKTLLEKASQLHPNSEGILDEYYALHERAGAWHDAKAIAEKLTALEPQHAAYHFRLGRAYAFLKDEEHAQAAYITGLEQRHDTSLEQLITHIKQGFTTVPTAFSSEYVYISGKNNYGAIIHHTSDRTYVTKIMKHNKQAKREMAFYRDIRPAFPSLEAITPACIDTHVWDRIAYVTMEWVDGSPVTFEQAHDVIQTAKRIASVSYREVQAKHPNPTYAFRYNNRPTFVIQFFTQIHTRTYNTKLFAELSQLIEQYHYPKSAKQVVKRLEAQIMDNHLYAFIEPEKHYALLHGDFHPSNIKRENRSDALTIFDWATFTTGPHFIDIARYLSKELFPFQAVKDIYLDNSETGGTLTLIEKIFFLYALVLLYLLRLKAKEAEKHMDDCILPALEAMDGLARQFKETEYDASLLKLREEKEEHQDDIKQLENELETINKQNKSLREQNHRLQKQYTQITDSKSWRMTAPMRKLMEKLHKDRRKHS